VRPPPILRKISRKIGPHRKSCATCDRRSSPNQLGKVPAVLEPGSSGGHLKKGNLRTLSGSRPRPTAQNGPTRAMLPIEL
jgi:hypothetical protein